MTGIDVDVEGLAEFRAYLNRELDTSLAPSATAIGDSLRCGSGFGARVAGINVQNARRAYALALNASISNLREFIYLAEALTAAIVSVSERYSEADDSSQRVIEEVVQFLTAQRQADAARVALSQAAETRREDHRAQIA